jgi:hypothetical protein
MVLPVGQSVMGQLAMGQQARRGHELPIGTLVSAMDLGFPKENTFSRETEFNSTLI